MSFSGATSMSLPMAISEQNIDSVKDHFICTGLGLYLT